MNSQHESVSPPPYRIEDEPMPGGLARLVVSPIWPLFGTMLGGAWLGLPWFVINGFALGSATRRRELLTALIGFAGAAVLAVTVLLLAEKGLVQVRSIKYLALAPLTWKLAVCYVLYNMQNRSFALFQYYGGTVRSGTLVIVVAVVLGRGVLALFKHPLALMVFG